MMYLLLTTTLPVGCKFKLPELVLMVSAAVLRTSGTTTAVVPTMLPPDTLPVTDTVVPVTLPTRMPIMLPPEMLAVVVILAADTRALTTLPLRLNPTAFTLPPVMLPDALTLAAPTAAAVIILPPVTLPVALTTPVTYSPVAAHTTTFDVPPTPTAILPPELTTVTFDVPSLMFDDEVLTPVSNEPLPKI